MQGFAVDGFGGTGLGDRFGLIQPTGQQQPGEPVAWGVLDPAVQGIDRCITQLRLGWKCALGIVGAWLHAQVVLQAGIEP